MEELVRGYYIQGYQEGFRDGSNSGQQADVKIELVQFLEHLDIKGIGEKTKEKILQAYKERGLDNESNL